MPCPGRMLHRVARWLVSGTSAEELRNDRQGRSRSAATDNAKVELANKTLLGLGAWDIAQVAIFLRHVALFLVDGGHGGPAVKMTVSVRSRRRWGEHAESPDLRAQMATVLYTYPLSTAPRIYRVRVKRSEDAGKVRYVAEVETESLASGAVA